MYFFFYIFFSPPWSCSRDKKTSDAAQIGRPEEEAKGSIKMALVSRGVPVRVSCAKGPDALLKVQS